MTRTSISNIRKGISLYLIVVILGLVIGVISGVVIAIEASHGASLLSPTPSSNCSTLGTNNNSTVCTPSVSYPGTLGLVGPVILLAAVALASFILTIVAWLRWREGIKALPMAVLEYGPQFGDGARRALRDYDYTVYMFIVSIVVSIASAVTVLLIVFSIAFSQTPSSLSSFAVELTEVVLVFDILVAVVEFLIYYFASASLRGALYPLAGPAEKQALDQGRMLMIVGAVLVGIAAFSTVVSAILGLVVVAGYAVLAYGLYTIRSAYDRWLANPMPPPMFP